MALRIEKDLKQEEALRGQGESYSVFSGKLLIAGVVEMFEWRLVDRKCVVKCAGWAWGMDVTISARAAPPELPQGGKASSLDEAIEKINEAWDLWIQYLGLAKTGT